MRKFVAGLVLALSLAVPGIASADQPGNGNGPPSLCDTKPWLPQCDGGVNVEVDEATLEECPTGGYVIVIGESRFPVCNGADGEDGAPGTPGTPGAPGEDGQDGTDGVNGQNGQNGANGLDGANGQNGRNAPVLAPPRECVSKRHPVLRIRYKGAARITNLRAWFEGVRVKIKRVPTPDPHPSSNARKLREWKVKVPLAGKPAGVYGVTIRYRKDGKRRSQVHLYRSCFTEANNGFGLNARPIVRL